MSDMTYMDIEEKVLEIVRDTFCNSNGDERNRVTPETDFRNDLSADSLDAVEMLMELEDAFEIQIPDEVTDKISTVREAIDYIAKRFGEKTS